MVHCSAGVNNPDAAAAGVCKGKFCCPGCDAELSVEGAPTVMLCSACKMPIIGPAEHAVVEGSKAHKAAIAREKAEYAKMPKWMKAMIKA